MNILITGGAGYIGSHMVRMAAKNNLATITVLDTMENGHKESLPDGIELVVGSVGDEKVLTNIFASKKYDAVIHFAGYIRVEESVSDPQKYMHNNLIGPLTLLQSMEMHHVNKIIFSSTAAVYGFPIEVPIPEDHPKNPESPYGLSKWCFEQLLEIYDRRNIIRSICLRYFNASGASLDSMYGEDHTVETHIIPKAFSTILGEPKKFYLYGTDYDTKDGTCERDYVHVEDLGQAHIIALDALMNGHNSDIYNIGTGYGITNKEIVSEVKRQSNKEFPVEFAPRRAGDPSILVANPKKIMTDLGWKPKYSDITTIISTAWKWHQTHPKGY